MEEFNKEYLDSANQLVGSVGLTSVLGMEFISITKGEAVAKIDLDERHMNFRRGAHGGTLFALCDTTGGFAVATLGKLCTTVNSSIEYMRPVIGCDTIFCSAKVVKYGKTLSWVDCEIKNEEDVVLCTAKLVYYLLEDVEKSKID